MTKQEHRTYGAAIEIVSKLTDLMGTAGHYGERWSEQADSLLQDCEDYLGEQEEQGLS
mgnify:CR=1 FL=1